KATQMVSDSIEAGNVNALNYFLGQKYVDAFAQLASGPNQKFVIVPMETAGLLGSIAGIAEMAKDAIVQQQNPTPRPPRTPAGTTSTTPPTVPPVRPAGT
ncbi:MAG TPA: band-7 C-terminal domain-containing protein, partial [Bradyrhizobium sp.]